MPVCVWHGRVQCVAVWPWTCVCHVGAVLCTWLVCVCARVHGVGGEHVGRVGGEQSDQEDGVVARLPPHCLENGAERSLLYVAVAPFTSERGQDA